MREILWFLVKIAISFACIGLGLFLIDTGLERDNDVLSITGLIFILAGLVYGFWLYISNGLTLSDD